MGRVPGQHTTATEAEDRERRVRYPELALGVVCIAGAALAAVVWQATGDRSSEVAVLARDVTRGTVLTAADLRPARMQVPDGVAVVPVADARRLIGRVAAADLPAGTVASLALTIERPSPAADERIVGMALSPGEAPVRLRRGDRVDVLRTPTTGTGTPGGPEVLVTGAIVTDVERPADEYRPVQVGVIVPAGAAPAVAAAVATRQLRLVGVGTGAGS
jgi:hypothetical protein